MFTVTALKVEALNVVSVLIQAVVCVAYKTVSKYEVRICGVSSCNYC